MICVSHFLILEVTMCHYSPPNPLLWFSLSPMPPVSQHNQTTKQCRISSKKHDNVWRQPCPQEICECNLWLLQCSGNKKHHRKKWPNKKTNARIITWRSSPISLDVPCFSFIHPQSCPTIPFSKTQSIQLRGCWQNKEQLRCKHNWKTHWGI